MPATGAAFDHLVAAFPPVPLDTRRALNAWGRTYGSGERFEAETNGKAWTEIPASVAEWHHDILRFLDPPHLAQLLPAFMSALLAQTGLDQLPRFLCSVLTPDGDDDEKFKLRVAALSDEQRRAIAAVLAAVRDGREREERPRYEFLDRALTSYWAAYAEEAC